METIRNYLEAMFANMPNTPEVKKAKAELLSMMEDKFNEMIEDGVNENTAIGTVISEFGNLDELAEDLGLTKEVEEVHVREQEVSRRFVSANEVQNYIDSERKSGMLIGIGVLLCICSVVGPIIADSINLKEVYGVAWLFACIIIAVAIFVYNGVSRDDWKFLKKEPCQIDMATAKLIGEKRKDFKTTRAWMLTVGVILCAFSWIPCAALEQFEVVSSLLFVFVGIGVFLIIYSSTIYSSYETILNLNDKTTISGSYGREDEVQYINKTAEMVMDLYWPTITCIYLIISFLTFDWHTTWIIWPVAAIVRKILNTTLEKED